MTNTTHGAQPGKGAPKKEMAARPNTTATTSSNQHADGSATTTKSEANLRHFVGDSSLNRFETERHHDHCLPSTVPSLAERFAMAGHTLHRTDPQDGPVAALLEAARQPARPSPRYKLLGADELRDLPPLAWRVRGVLPAVGLTYSRNTVKVRALKVKLVLAFRETRRAAEVREGDYLPADHALPDALKVRAAGSPNERFMHINANKTLNQPAGVQAGRRAGAGMLQQSMLAIGSAVAARAVQEAQNGHGLHQHITTALKPLEGVLALEGQR